MKIKTNIIALLLTICVFAIGSGLCYLLAFYTKQVLYTFFGIAVVCFMIIVFLGIKALITPNQRIKSNYVTN